MKTYDYTGYKALEINVAEKEAIKKYAGPFHTSMNALLDLDPDYLLKLTNKGWRIDKISKNDIKKYIDDLKKIYSAMYKYNKINIDRNKKVYRGTTNDEVKRLNTDNNYNRFISTSTDKDIAMNFTEYQNGAMLEVDISPDVLYLEMDDFLDNEQASESEILIAPYSNIEKIQKNIQTNQNGVKEYSLKITKKDFDNLSDIEEKECEDFLNEFDLAKEINVYSELTDEYEGIYTRLSNITPEIEKEDKELKLQLQKKEIEIRDKLSKSKEFFKNASKVMNKYLQGKFKSIEVDIEKDINKEKLEKQNKNRQNEILRYKKCKEKLLENIEFLDKNFDKIKNEYLCLDDEEIALHDISSDIGLEKKDENETVIITSMFETLKENIENIKEEIEKIEISDELSSEELNISGTLNTKINEKFEQINKMLFHIEELKNDVLAVKLNNTNELKKDISKKIKSDINDKIISNFSEQKNTLLLKKDTLIDRLFGKVKLKNAEIENLELKIESIKKGGLNIPEDFDKMQSYLNTYTEIVGTDNLPKEIQNFLININKNNSNKERNIENRELFELYFNINAPIEQNKKISRKDRLLNISLQNQKLKTIINTAQISETVSDDFQKNLNKQKTSKLEKDLNTLILVSNSNSLEYNQKNIEQKELE